jgi:hypothetical protein
MRLKSCPKNSHRWIKRWIKAPARKTPRSGYKWPEVITTPTVLILGAGASCPYGFPTAKELKILICKTFKNPTATACQFLGNNTEYSPDEFFEFREAFLRSNKSSVDAFLEYRPDFLEVGRLAIAYSLIPFEDETKLYRPDESRGGDWYGYLCDKLSSSFEEFGNNKLSIITFNYDRSLEHCLLNSLHYSHNKEFDECAQTLAKIPIIHVYGQLSTCSYSSYPLQCYNQYRPDRDRLINVGAARGITLLHEEESGEAEAARKVLEAAKRVCFLGFSYHPLNVARLKIDTFFDLSTTIVGTARGWTEMEKQVARSRLTGAMGGDPHLYNEDNLGILRHTTFLG